MDKRGILLVLLVLIPTVSAYTAFVENKILTIDGSNYKGEIPIYRQDNNIPAALIELSCDKCLGRNNYNLNNLNLNLDKDYYFYVCDYNNQGNCQKFNFDFGQIVGEDCEYRNCIPGLECRGPDLICCGMDKECGYNNKCYDIGEFTSNGQYVCSDLDTFQTCENYCNEQGKKCENGKCVSGILASSYTNAKDCTEAGYRWHYRVFDRVSIRVGAPQNPTPNQAATQGICSENKYDCYYDANYIYPEYNNDNVIDINGHKYTCGHGSRAIVTGEKKDFDYTDLYGKKWPQVFDGVLYDSDSGSARCAMAVEPEKCPQSKEANIAKNNLKDCNIYPGYYSSSRLGQSRCCGDDDNEKWDGKSCVFVCDDGTIKGECSSLENNRLGQPKYCNQDLELIDDCFSCGCPSDEQKCLMDGTCSSTINKLEFTGLATDKKVYNLGDEIKLIDNSDLALSGGQSKKNGKEFYLNSPLISEQDKLLIKQKNKYPYYGFIIEFKNPSILGKRVELELSNTQGFKGALYKIAPGLIPDINKQLQQYSRDLKKEHEEFLNINTGVAKIAAGQNREFTELFNGVVLNINENEAKNLLKNPNVKAVYPNYLVHINLMDSVSQINADKVWNLKDNSGDFINGKGINVVVIDTGIDYTHPDFGNCTKEQFLAGKCKKVKGGYDFVNNDNDPMDDMGHGTHVAGIIAADGVLKGVAPGVNLYSYKVLDATGSGTEDVIMNAIEMAADPNSDYNFDDHMDIISISLGGGGDSNDPMSKMVDNVVAVGVVAVIAAGNSGPELTTIGSPGTARDAITVGASCKPSQYYSKTIDYHYNETSDYCNPTNAGEVPGVAWFSSRGPANIFEKPDVVAPGVDICSSQSSQDTIWQSYKTKYNEDIHCVDNKHIAISGTSMATPMVAGAVALIKQAHPDWTPYQIKSALKNDAKPFGYNRLIEGAGQIDVLKAVQDKNIYPIVKLKEGIEEGNNIDYIG